MTKMSWQKGPCETIEIQNLVVSFNRKLTSYTGKQLNGLPNGQGTGRSVDGRKFIGIWKRGFIGQEGTLQMANKLRYEGRFLHSKAHGIGTLYRGNTTVFSGEWEKGRFVLGELTLSNKVTYIGGFKKNVLNSDAEIKYPDRTVAECEFKKGEPVDFQGVYFINNMKFEGNWSNRKSKTGSIIYSNNDDLFQRYEGGLFDLEYGGKGTVTYKNGKEESGKFKAGIPVTYKGQLRDERNGIVFDGNWVKKVAKNAEITLSNGDVFKTKFVNMNFRGPFTFESHDGHVFEGKLQQNSRIIGQGTLTIDHAKRSDEQTYLTGTWTTQKQECEGEIIYPSGSQFKGQFDPFYHSDTFGA